MFDSQKTRVRHFKQFFRDSQGCLGIIPEDSKDSWDSWEFLETLGIPGNSLRFLRTPEDFWGFYGIMETFGIQGYSTRILGVSSKIQDSPGFSKKCARFLKSITRKLNFGKQKSAD